METLEIRNFLSIKTADLDLRRINIFIGPQAQGKSVISKLIYFFKSSLSEMFDAITEDKTRSSFTKSQIEKFESIFPKYAWEKTEFIIEYSTSTYDVSIVHTENNSGRLKLSLSYSERFVKGYESARRLYRKSIVQETEATSSRAQMMLYRAVRQHIAETFSDAFHTKALIDPIYIPAGRSFFANLQKNVFSFLSSSIQIDYFLKEFGSIYERSRERHIINAAAEGRPKSVATLVEKLICGRYHSEKGQDWIIDEAKRVNVSHSSSGQQEALPLAMVLSTWPYLEQRHVRRHFVIEEPEAHLFPVAQGQVAQLIAEAYNAPGHKNSFVITTHSPYILTAFNNLIQAGNVEHLATEEEDTNKLDSLYKIVPQTQTIWPGDIAAFSVGNGFVNNIFDNDINLINANAIDETSNHFAATFEALLDMEV